MGTSVIVESIWEVKGEKARGKNLRVCLHAQGSPLGRRFGRFVAAARVNVLGLVPSIARAWRASGCMQVGAHACHGACNVAD